MDYYEDNEIEEITLAGVGKKMTREMVFSVYQLTKMQLKISKIGIELSGKDFKEFKKHPKESLQRWLQRTDGSQESMLVLFDICIEYQVKTEPIWILLFEQIRDPM